MLVRGKAGDSQDSLAASSIIVMKQADVAQKQQKDLQDWQRRGSGGIVTAIDPATGAVTVSVNPALSVKVKTTKDTEFLRYAANSVKFSDAQKAASIKSKWATSFALVAQKAKMAKSSRRKK